MMVMRMSLIRAVISGLYGGELGGERKLPGRSRRGLGKTLDKVGEYLSAHRAATWIIRTVIIAALMFSAWALVHCYNQYAHLNTSASAYLAQVGVEMKRRNNLIPNLIEVAKKYAVYEGDVFKHVSDAREVFVGAGSTNDKIQAGNQLDSALSRLLAVFEQYPDLKAAQPMQDLIKEIANTENRIADQKAKYNDVARQFNQIRQSFPTNILGRLYGFQDPLVYISAEEDLIKTPMVRLEWKEREGELDEDG